jgi:glutamine amidotransferase
MQKLSPKIAIVDYSLGNLFSIKHACEYAGLSPIITSDKNEILSADAVLLPGMGAYGDAMKTLHKLDLVSVLHDFAQSGKYLIGVCLGIQLLMRESCEFGNHKGLGIIEGTVEPLDHPLEGERFLKVPQIGWNQLKPARTWSGTPLNKIPVNEYMYFVHSFFPSPEDKSTVVTTTTYGGIEFCSSLMKENIFACLFHPERSGKYGLQIYENFSALISKSLARND